MNNRSKQCEIWVCLLLRALTEHLLRTDLTASLTICAFVFGIVVVGTLKQRFTGWSFLPMTNSCRILCSFIFLQSVLEMCSMYEKIQQCSKTSSNTRLLLYFQNYHRKHGSIQQFSSRQNHLQAVHSRHRR